MLSPASQSSALHLKTADAAGHSPFGFRHSAAHGAAAGISPAFSTFVESFAPTAVVSPGTDITFACSHCTSPLVVDAAAAGMTLPCQKCGKPTVVPAVAARGSAADPNSRMSELRRQLKENESQRTEVTGYINQLSIQLHRWQLRLQTLEERRKQLEADLQSER
jgi:hypothetical protein